MVGIFSVYSVNSAPSAILYPNPRYQPTAENHWIYIGNPNKQTPKKLQNTLKIAYNIYKK